MTRRADDRTPAERIAAETGLPLADVEAELERRRKALARLAFKDYGGLGSGSRSDGGYERPPITAETTRDPFEKWSGLR